MFAAECGVEDRWPNSRRTLVLYEPEEMGMGAEVMTIRLIGTPSAVLAAALVLFMERVRWN
jgi:hypothetical protein